MNQSLFMNMSWIRPFFNYSYSWYCWQRLFIFIHFIHYLLGPMHSPISSTFQVHFHKFLESFKEFTKKNVKFLGKYQESTKDCSAHGYLVFYKHVFLGCPVWPFHWPSVLKAKLALFRCQMLRSTKNGSKSAPKLGLSLFMNIFIIHDIFWASYSYSWYRRQC